MPQRWIAGLMLILVINTLGLGQDLPIDVPKRLPPTASGGPERAAELMPNPANWKATPKAAVLAPIAPTTSVPATLPYTPLVASPYATDCKTECCVACGPYGMYWVRAEYLFWNVRGAQSPPLISGSPAGTSVNQAGVLGTPGSTVLFGGDDINSGFQSGFQVRAGEWWDPCHIIGFEAGGFMLGGQSQNAVAGSTTGAIVSRPFINAQTGQNDAQLVSFPGVLNGFVSVNAETPRIYGFDAVLRARLCCVNDPGCDPCSPNQCGTKCNDPRSGGYTRLDFLAGYRHFYYSDQLSIREDLQPQGGLFAPGTQITVLDQFRAINRFNGVSLGFDLEYARGSWFIDGQIRANIGENRRTVNINGQTIVQVPGQPPAVSVGGLLAQSSNIGAYESTSMVVIPEGSLRVGYNLTKSCRLFAGYNLIIWPKVARSAEQIDPVVNRTQIPQNGTAAQGSLRPAFFGNTSTLWIQGVTLGLEYRF
ncbi:MAG: BBP7 family outer membrane beta-barrel protein [Planctomycetes bacterium]|nr:BBP7 family outer membrane beta-barrel protein [Planctomycetota bacterium]